MNKAYYDAWEQITLSAEADERIRLLLAQPRPERRRAHRKGIRRKAPKLIAAAAVVVVLLSATALAVAQPSFSEIAESLRLLLGIESKAVPAYIQYETVTEAPDAWVSDPAHKGTGEVYVSVNHSIYSENFLTVELELWSVTAEQYADYVWRVQLAGEEEYIAAQPIGWYERYTGGNAVVRVAIMQESLQSGQLLLSVFGGYETDGGSGFAIERAGAVSVTVPAQDESVRLSLDGGIAFLNEETGEEGLITAVELHTACMIVYYHMDGIYSPDQDIRETPDFLAWQNSAYHFMADAALNLAGGESLLWLPGTYLCLPDDTVMVVMDFQNPIDLKDAESIVIGGQVYGFPELDGVSRR